MDLNNIKQKLDINHKVLSFWALLSGISIYSAIRGLIPWFIPILPVAIISANLLNVAFKIRKLIK